VGQRLEGRYTLLEAIGRGGMGQVYLARHELIGKEVVLKVLRPELLGVEGGLERFRREAQAAAGIDSPHVVNVTDFGVDRRGRAYVVMEHLRGCTLRSAIREGPVAPSLVIERSCQILLALEAAHRQGVVHRDIKPENIFVSPGPPEVVKVLDFGLAKIIGPVEWTEGGGLTASGAVMGTPHYMAPEQADDNGDVGPRSDLYSVGIVMYEMLTGRRPFEASSPLAMLLKHREETPVAPARRRPKLKIPAALDALVIRALSKRPEDRFDSAAEMRQALDAVDVAAAGAAGPSLRRRWLLWPVAGAVLTAVVATTAIVLLGDRQAAQAPVAAPDMSLVKASPVAPPDMSPVKIAPPRPTARPDLGDWVVIAVRPSVAGARVTVDGRPAGAGPVRVRLQRSNRPVIVKVRAAEHRTVQRTIVPDRDLTLPVRLEPLFRPARRLGLEHSPYKKP
jgi:serine/threonine-protein kinase